MRRMVVGWIAVAVGACHGEKTGTVAGPPLTITPAIPTPTTSTPPPRQPPSAVFQTLSAGGVGLPFAACREVIVAIATGRAAVAGEGLAPGDVLAVRGVPEPMGASPLTGQGLALVVRAEDPDCRTLTSIVRAAQARELTFMQGAMHARLDVDNLDIAPFYFGRLSGTAGVAEHAHDQSWEVLCAFEASGTFTLRGEASRLGPRTCVSVAPGAKHSWKPDPGSNLVAVQMYAPPGPEQRFKKLAAAEAPRDR